MAEAPVLRGLHDIFYHILPHLTPDSDTTIASGYLYETPDSQYARKALARLARTHRSFTKPALGVMWRSLHSQKPLEDLLCVVGIARRVQQPGHALSESMEMCRTPAAHEAGWLRFQEYAALVREIILDPLVPSIDDAAELMEDTFWCQLSSAVGNVPILPRLKGATLRSMSSRCSLDLGMFRLLHPSIHELKIAFPQAREGDFRLLKEAFLASFSSTENLEVLSIELSDLTPVLRLESLPRSHPRLRYLKLAGSASIQLNHLHPLATLPNLEYLSFTLSRDWEPLDAPITLAGLRTLAACCYEFDALGILLAYVDAPQLRAFSISETHMEANNVSEELPGHLRTLLAKCPRLTTFDWTSLQVWTYGVTGLGHLRSDMALAELVAPLLAQRTMRHFSAQFRGPVVPYTIDDFHAFAQAWPDLETFLLQDKPIISRISIGTDEDHWADRCVDVESIFAFARHCPRLRSLDIPRVVVQREPVSAPSNPSGSARGGVKPLGRPVVPHWLGELWVDHVVYAGAQRTRGRGRDSPGQFRRLMEEVFPSAIIRVRDAQKSED